MGVCKIQKPTGIKDKHGKIIIQIICNDNESDEVKFDAIKGDLRFNLICEEEEGTAFYIGSDFEQEIKKLNEKIEIMQEQINELKTNFYGNNL
jgi:hypothetical protein